MRINFSKPKFIQKLEVKDPGLLDHFYTIPQYGPQIFDFQKTFEDIQNYDKHLNG